MVIARCESCGAERPMNGYMAPDDWFFVHQGPEDASTLCSMSCLANWSMVKVMEEGLA